MPHIPYPREEQISPDCKSILDEFHHNYGRPSHIFRVMSWNPTFLKVASDAWTSIVVKPSRLKRWVKEAIVVITATAQGAEYCIQGHSNALRRQGLSQQIVNEVQNRAFSGYSEPERSIFLFAQTAASSPKSLTPGDYEKLRKLGFDDETILEVLAVVWVNTAMNNVVEAVGMKRTQEQMKELEIA